MINTKIIIQPKEIHLRTQQTLNVKVVFKRTLLTTNHQIQKGQCSNITLKNGIGIITNSIAFKLNRQFELSNSKVCFDIISVKGKAITFLGNGSFDLLPYANRTVNELKCRIQRCKDIYAHIQFILRFQEMIQQSPKKQFERQNPKTLYTESFENQSILINRRQQRDKPTAYQISRKNYKHVDITRDQAPTTKRDLSGSYKKRFQYMSKSRVSNEKSKQSKRESQSPNNSKITNKISKHSPCPRLKTPEPIIGGQSPQVKTRIRHPQKEAKKTKQKTSKLQQSIQNKQADMLAKNKTNQERMNQIGRLKVRQHDQIKADNSQGTKQLNKPQQSKYKDISDKLQWIQQQIKSRQHDKSPKQRSPRTIRDKTTVTAKDSQYSKRPHEKSVNEYSNGMHEKSVQQNTNIQTSGKVYQSKVQQYRGQLQQQMESKSPRVIEQPQVKKFQHKFENIDMSLEKKQSKKNQQGSDSKIRQSKIKVYKMDDKSNKKIIQQSDSQGNLQTVKSEVKIKQVDKPPKSPNNFISQATPSKSPSKINQNKEVSTSAAKQNPMSETTYKMMQENQYKLMHQIQIFKQQLEQCQLQKHEIKKSYIKQQNQLAELKFALAQKQNESNKYDRQAQIKKSKQIFQKYQIQIQQLQEQNKNKQALIEKLTDLCEKDGSQRNQNIFRQTKQLQNKIVQFQAQNKHLKQQLKYSQNKANELERLNIQLQSQIKIFENKLQQSNLLNPKRRIEQQISEISSQGHSFNISVDQAERQRKHKSELSQYKQKCINLQSQCRYKQNELKFLKIKMDTLKQQKDDLQCQIDSMVHNNKLQLAKRDSVAKFSQSSISITNNLMDQNKALKEQIEILKQQLHQLNELMSGSSSKNMLAVSRTNINSTHQQKLQRLQRKVDVYQNDLKLKKMQFGKIINLLMSNGDSKLVDQVNLIINNI